MFMASITSEDWRQPYLDLLLEDIYLMTEEKLSTSSGWLKDILLKVRACTEKVLMENLLDTSAKRKSKSYYRKCTQENVENIRGKGSFTTNCCH